ncbi:hypothetical protein ANANG_G00038010 [Anguilla anguilla]|uniref:Uncharacterized protein n=1 Tax=Anguilla anguilla TaxID=7936 RepID=A0A9D3MVB3_ANGAN|nr:hypothetical protein ANANG_G00038010 [Anguilla anguilla]
MSDIRHSLLRRDALSAAKEVLYHLDIYFSSQLQNTAVPIVDKGTIELVEEFIFHVPKDRNVQPKRMNSLQELQLLEIMCSYFQEQSKDAVRQIIFSALFSPQGNKADDNRMAMLGKLVSMAVAVCRVPILECAASWLQVLMWMTTAAWCQGQSRHSSRSSAPALDSAVSLMDDSSLCHCLSMTSHQRT